MALKLCLKVSVGVTLNGFPSMMDWSVETAEGTEETADRAEWRDWRDVLIFAFDSMLRDRVE
jgi:hypothetical protein